MMSNVRYAGALRHNAAYDHDADSIGWMETVVFSLEHSVSMLEPS